MRPRIMIGQYDVTEHVAAMYDAIVASLDWGSEFLDAETQQSILLVGQLAGFDWKDPAMPSGAFADEMLTDLPNHVQRLTWRQERIDCWRAQVKAAIDAKAIASIDSETCESVATELLTHVERIGK